MSIKEADDLTKDYSGNPAIKVTVASNDATKFKFQNVGEYSLVDDNKANLTKGDTDKEKYRIR